ncbi:amidase family protein [Pseudonocardia sp. C8]|uniref:amidase family protein n=1 Tax=Pseudonocardia sp. C8 TaxID=2762759 RepID=UPI001C92D872
MTWAFNLTGHPAVSIPAGFTSDGCPVGLQLVAAPGHDGLLLRLLEEHVPPTPPPIPRRRGRQKRAGDPR